MMGHVTIDISKSGQSEAMRKLRATQTQAHDALQRLAKDAREAIGVAEHWAEVIDDLTERAAKSEAAAKKAKDDLRTAETNLQHEKHAHSQTRKQMQEMRDARDKLFLKYEAVGSIAPASVQKIDAKFARENQVTGSISIPNPQQVPKWVACQGYGISPWFVAPYGAKDMHQAVTNIPNRLSAFLLAKLLNDGAIDHRPGDYHQNYTC